jgi:hypothetical protein
VFLKRASNEAGGFDALVGNPPFSRGQNIAGPFGEDYRDHLVNNVAGGRRGIANLCVFFTLRAAMLVRPGGILGLLADKSIAEGDSRVVGTRSDACQRYRVFAAWHKFPWPGSASVAASEVHLNRPDPSNMTWARRFTLEGTRVPHHLPLPDCGRGVEPEAAEGERSKSFQGSIVLGLGFTMSGVEAQALIACDAKNAESAATLPKWKGPELAS